MWVTHTYARDVSLCFAHEEEEELGNDPNTPNAEHPQQDRYYLRAVCVHNQGATFRPRAKAAARHRG